MAVLQFPPIELADRSGLLAIGGDLEVATLRLAYSQGIFPWPYSDRYPLGWYAPDPRGILEYESFRPSTSFKKLLKKNPFEIRFNTNFSEVIKGCADSPNRGGQRGTWITSKMMAAYTNFFKAGYAFSVEVYLEDRLVGGLYGVAIDNFISGESMFYTHPNASKVALWALMEKIKERGIDWMDTQMVTPVVAQLGGVEIPRKLFMEKLKGAIEKGMPGNQILNS